MTYKIEQDITIIGGGIVGAAVCCALAEVGFSIRLLEPSIPDFKVGVDYDLRVSAISKASQKFLDKLDVWSLIESTRVSPYRQMRVWEENSQAAVHFDSAEISEPHLGYIVENELIRQTLFEKISTYPNVSVQTKVDIAWTDFSPAIANIALQSGDVLSSKLVIGADGANSKVRDWVGVEVLQKHTGHHGLVANVMLDKSHQQTAWQKFLKTGPIAFLPLADGSCSIVWSTNQQHVADLMAMSENAFLSAVNVVVGDAPFSPILGVSQRLAFPLIERHAKRYYQHNVVLIGDAAHTVHPLAGQGVNLGLADAKALAETLILNKKDFNRPHVLTEYARSRRLNNVLMLQSMRAFKEIFATNNKTLGALRGAGMLLFNKSHVAKKLAMKAAMNG